MSRRSELPSYCRICEAQCGVVGVVEDGRLVDVLPDPENPLSRGQMCVKAKAMIDVVYDPDRVLRPLKRVGRPGEFEEVGWDEALADIARRLRGVVGRGGPDAFAAFQGNPLAFSYSMGMWCQGLLDTIGSRSKYSINSEDSAARMAANHILYGSTLATPKPDIWNTDLLLLIGTNPDVSHGSALSEPRVRAGCDGVVARGGRVVVIDPRRTETARRYEHQPVRAGADAHLLLGMLHTMIGEERLDDGFIQAHTRGLDDLRRLVEPFAPEAAAGCCGVPAPRIRELARDFAAAPTAVIHGRTGTCTQRFGTLVNLLQDLLNLVTGNCDRRGGAVFNWSPFGLEAIGEQFGFNSVGRFRSRVTGLPEVMGLLPSTALAPDIVTPGQGQVRALLTCGANPMLTSAGGGEPLAEALEQLDLHFALDLYVNETNQHAHYVLPVTSFYEREDVTTLLMGNMLRPVLMATRAVIQPVGEARQEWQILDEVVRRMGLGGAYSAPALRRLARLGLRLGPRVLVDAMLRTSTVGDRFGLRPSGLSLRKLLARHPHGVQLREEVPAGELLGRLQREGRRLPLAPAELSSEIERLRAHRDPQELPLRLIGMREIRTHNSWMHNVARLARSGHGFSARVHPVDAAAVGLREGDRARILSAAGSVTVPVRVTDEMTPGNVALPNGWGHEAGWQRANAAGGVNSNQLASGAVEDIEPVAGMSLLNGIPIRLEAAE